MATFTVTPKDKLANVLLPVPQTLGSVSLETLENTTVLPSHWRLKQSGNFRVLVLAKQQAKKEVGVLAR
jgi:hypothetical protein